MPNLIAKPIINIAIGIENLSNAKKVIEIIEKELSYHYDATKEKIIPNRRHLWKGSQKAHLFHLWIVEIDGKDWKDMI